MPVLDVYLSAYLRYIANYCRIYIQTNNFDKNTSTVFLPVAGTATSRLDLSSHGVGRDTFCMLAPGPAQGPRSSTST